MILSSCGYRVGGTASRLPPGLKVIAVPALLNRTNQYRVEQRMTQAVVREFLARTKYRIVSTEDSADATKKVLYKNDNYLFREAYEISTDPTSFFDEQDPALDRMARDFASRLVADVMENF